MAIDALATKTKREMEKQKINRKRSREEDNESKPSKKKTRTSKKLYLDNLSCWITKEKINEFFCDCGEVADIKLICYKKRFFRGSGYIGFSKQIGIDNAMAKNGELLDGYPVRIYDIKRGRSKTLHMYNVDYNATVEKLKEFFKDCGTILDVHILEKNTQRR